MDNYNENCQTAANKAFRQRHTFNSSDKMSAVAKRQASVYNCSLSRHWCLVTAERKVSLAMAVQSSWITRLGKYILTTDWTKSLAGKWQIMKAWFIYLKWCEANCPGWVTHRSADEDCKDTWVRQLPAGAEFGGGQITCHRWWRQPSTPQLK